MVPNDATLSGMETVSAVLADLGASAPDSKKISASQNDVPKPAQGLVLGGGLPSVPAEILHRIHKNSYVELSELLPEKILSSTPMVAKRRRPLSTSLLTGCLHFVPMARHY